MFKKENRLSTNFEFNITRKHGKKLAGELFYLYYLKPNNYQGSTKIGIVVSNKLHKVAAKRNRIKRLFRESLKPHLEKLPKNLWIVVHPTSKSLNAAYEKISTEIDKTVSKISIT